MDECLLPKSELSEIWGVTKKSETCLRYELIEREDSYIRVCKVNKKYAIKAVYNGETVSSPKPIFSQNVKNETQNYMNELESRVTEAT